MANTRNRGLKAVERVRSLRENDARHGVAEAMNDLRSAQAERDRLDAALGHAGQFDHGPAGQFRIHRRDLATRADDAKAARVVVEGKQLLADDARARWVDASNRLQVVTDLIERRDVAHRSELDRAEARGLEDIASTAWLRNTRKDHA
jgi:flagellar FliJ protein